MANSRNKDKHKREGQAAQVDAPESIFPFDHLLKDLKRRIIMLLGPLDARLAHISRVFSQTMNTLEFWALQFKRYFPVFIADLNTNNGLSYSQKFGARFAAQQVRVGSYQNGLFISACAGNTEAIFKKIKYKQLEVLDDNKRSLVSIAAEQNNTFLQKEYRRLSKRFYKNKRFNQAVQNEIAFAVICGEPVEELNKLYKAGIELDPPISNKYKTATHLAAQYGHHQQLQFLLEKGARVNHALITGWTSLGMAARHNHVACAAVLLKFHAEINFKNGPKGQTALHLAAAFSYLEMLTMLIRSGANLEATNNKSRTPLTKAIMRKQIDAAIILVESGATMHTSFGQSSPFTRAIALGDIKLVQIMMNHGALKPTNELLDPRPAIICMIWNRLDIMWTLLTNGMTTSYRVADIEPIVQSISVTKASADQRQRFQEFMIIANNKEQNISVAKLAMLIGTEEMQDICNNPGVSPEQLRVAKTSRNNMSIC